MNQNKAAYGKFCETAMVPIYSQPWWLDAICLPDHWDVWICEENGTQLAAMPYYFENRNGLRYITKAPLTQNNGIIFHYPKKMKPATKAAFEENVIGKACDYIRGLHLDVYEQQYQPSFTNWLPFFWQHYTAITRYTYMIENTSDLQKVWEGISSKQRAIIRKGQRNSTLSDDLDPETFFAEHEKIYRKQNRDCPFSFELWKRLEKACREHDSGHILCRRTENGSVASVSFVVWDREAVYKLMGGPIPEYAHLDTYSALTWDEIELANRLGLKYDFEGSVIKRISKSFREYGGQPKPYFRIRKVFNPEVIRREAELEIERLKQE